MKTNTTKAASKATTNKPTTTKPTTKAAKAEPTASEMYIATEMGREAATKAAKATRKAG